MRKLTTVAAVVALMTMALPAAAASGESYEVTNDQDSGPGSLRDALESGESPIDISPDVGVIEVGDTLVWESNKQLILRGSGQTIVDSDGSAAVSILLIESGASASISNLGFEGPGGFGLYLKNTTNDDTAASGIKVLVPASARGTVSLEITDVSVKHVGLHGIHIDDLSNGGSRASVKLKVDNLTNEDNGNGGFDEDGTRVDEAGPGHIIYSDRDSYYHDVGADGVELDERGPGSVLFGVRDTDFLENGDYCEFRFAGTELDDYPGPFAPGMTLEQMLDEYVEIEDLAVVIEDGGDPGVPTDELVAHLLDKFDPNELECLEIADETDDGEREVEIAIDIDDAFDIDEADGGSIRGSFRGGDVTDNSDEGLDFDEAGSGDIVASVSGTSGDGNEDEIVKYSEEDGGHVVATVHLLDAPGEDLEFEEAGDGNLRHNITRSNIDDLALVEEDSGHLGSVIHRSTADNIEGEETGAGNFNMSITRSTVDGVELVQEAPGTGRFHTDDGALIPDLAGFE